MIIRFRLSNLIFLGGILFLSFQVFYNTFSFSYYFSEYNFIYSGTSLALSLVLVFVTYKVLTFSLSQGILFRDPLALSIVLILIFTVIFTSDCPQCGNWVKRIFGKENVLIVFPWYGLSLKILGVGIGVSFLKFRRSRSRLSWIFLVISMIGFYSMFVVSEILQGKTFIDILSFYK